VTRFAFWCLVGLAATNSAIAQQSIKKSAPQTIVYDGQWNARYTREDSLWDHGRLSLNGQSGTWRYISNHAPSGSRFPCLNRDFPVTAEANSPNELRVHIESSKLIRSCNDRTLTLKALEDNTLEGHFDGSDAAIIFTRAQGARPGGPAENPAASAPSANETRTGVAR